MTKQALIVSLVLTVACGHGASRDARQTREVCVRVRAHQCELLVPGDHDRNRQACLTDERTITDCIGNATDEIVACWLAAPTLDAYVKCIPGKQGDVQLDPAELDKAFERKNAKH